MKPEEAIQYFNDEIRLCKAAPSINGCQMTEDWQRTIDACEIAVAAIRKVSTMDMAQGERDAVTKHMIELEQEVGRLRAERAAYEDTGLEPEQILELKSFTQGGIHKVDDGWAHVQNLLQAEKDGRLVVLGKGENNG